MTRTTYRTMDVSELGDRATPADLVEFRGLCEAAHAIHPDWSDEEITDAVWGDGDYFANARRLGVEVE